MNGYPRLYIGRAAQELRTRVTFPIVQIDKDSISDIISYYSTIQSMSTPLVLDDIAYLSIQIQSELLKFIEDSPLKIILLSSEDTVLPTILSRMSLVYKLPDNVYSEFLPVSVANEELAKMDPDTHRLTYINKQIELSPLSYYYDILVENKPNRHKLLQLLGGN